jgi:DNA repair exonuclease SbcCD ATPase subunit
VKKGGKRVKNTEKMSMNELIEEGEQLNNELAYERKEATKVLEEMRAMQKETDEEKPSKEDLKAMVEKIGKGNRKKKELAKKIARITELSAEIENHKGH